LNAIYIPVEDLDFISLEKLPKSDAHDEIEGALRIVVRWATRSRRRLYTSATRYEKRSEAFLKTFELLTHYRTIDRLDALLDKLPWHNLKLVQDETGLQTYVHAVK
jgi:hypothetical protein